MDDQFKRKSTFVELFQFYRMIFGLTECSSNIPEAGKEWEFVSLYLDDVLMAPQPMKEHVKHIRKLPLHLQDVG